MFVFWFSAVVSCLLIQWLTDVEPFWIFGFPTQNGFDVEGGFERYISRLLVGGDFKTLLRVCGFRLLKGMHCLQLTTYNLVMLRPMYFTRSNPCSMRDGRALLK